MTTTIERLVTPPHRNQSVVMRIDEAFYDLMVSGLPSCPNELIVKRCRELLDAGQSTVDAVLADHLDYTEEIEIDGQRVMVAADDQEIEITCAALNDDKPIIVCLSDLCQPLVTERVAA